MFNWITSPQLPDTIDTQAFRSVAGQGPVLSINAINDRTHNMKLIPWEDILEVFPNAVYLLDASGIVLPARNSSSKRISPKSIKLQPDVVLQVVSSQDIPPRSTVPENIEKIEKSVKGVDSLTSTSLSTSFDYQQQLSRPSTSSVRGSSEIHAIAQGRLSSSSTTSHPEKTSGTTVTATAEDSDWSPFQANNASAFAASSSVPVAASVEQLNMLRQEMIHRMELLSAEQEERMHILLKACQRPGR
ncbi:hypothetical protein BGZ83_007733 [Gryganskiella cystojenkinii]|nr:hypothetical protein BGZ83_007733 [Gryganskiella cystojenkinii]